MDSVVTQGLVGLVVVLSIALWTRSSTLSSSPAPRIGTSSKKNRKKKKAAMATSSVESTVQTETSADLLRIQPATNQATKTHHVGGLPSLQNENLPNKGNESTKRSKKMPLVEFAAKTNEERIAELERAARGDAGDKDIGSDMLDKDMQPESRYMKVARIESAKPRPLSITATREIGWESVGGKLRAMPFATTKKTTDAAANAWASSNPFALLPGSGAEISVTNGKTATSPPLIPTTVARTSPSNQGRSGSNAAGQLQTKKQRQNAAKAQAKREGKEAMEQDRLARLAQHKRDVEQERISDFYKKQNPSPAPFTASAKGSSSQARILPKASINEKGSLVWE